MKKTLSKKKICLIKEYLDSIEGIDYAFLFGSALTHMRNESDVDILIGGNIDFDLQCEIMAQVGLICERDVDIVLSNKTNPSVVIKAMSKGKLIIVKDERRLKEDYFKMLRLSEDAERILRIKSLRLKREYSCGR